MYGDDYIHQHVQQQLLATAQTRTYRFYVTEALRAIANGQKITCSWTDIDTGYQPPRVEKDESQLRAEFLNAINKGGGQV